MILKRNSNCPKKGEALLTVPPTSGIAGNVGYAAAACPAAGRYARHRATVRRRPMTHAALINAALFFLVFLTLLLLMFIGAVMVAPSAPPRSGSPEAPAGETPAPPGLEAPIRYPAARLGDRHASRPAPTPGQPRTPRPDGTSGQTRGRCPRPPGGPPAARHRRAGPRLLAPRPGMPGTAWDADQQRHRRAAVAAELVWVLGIAVAVIAGGAVVALMGGLGLAVAPPTAGRGPHRAPGLCPGEGGAVRPAAPSRAAGARAARCVPA